VADGAQGRQSIQAIRCPVPIRWIATMMNVEIFISIAKPAAMVVPRQGLLSEYLPTLTNEIVLIGHRRLSRSVAAATSTVVTFPPKRLSVDPTLAVNPVR